MAENSETKDKGCVTIIGGSCCIFITWKRPHRGAMVHFTQKSDSEKTDCFGTLSCN